MPPKKKRAARSQPEGPSAAAKKAAGSGLGRASAEAKEATQPMATAREAGANECNGDADVVDEEPVAVVASKDTGSGGPVKKIGGRKLGMRLTQITQCVRLNLIATMHEVPSPDLAKELELPFPKDLTPIDYLVGTSCSSPADTKTFWSAEVVGRLMVSRCREDSRAMKYIQQGPDWKTKWDIEKVSAPHWWPPYISA